MQNHLMYRMICHVFLLQDLVTGIRNAGPRDIPYIFTSTDRNLGQCPGEDGSSVLLSGWTNAKDIVTDESELG